MPTLTKSNSSIVETIAILIAIVLVGWFLIKPQSAKLGAQKEQLVEAQSQFNQIDQDNKSLAQLTGKIKDAQADLPLIDEALPLNNRPTQLELLLDGLSTASGMRISEMNFQQSDTAAISAGNKALAENLYSANRKLHITTIDMGVIGSIDQFKNFLQLVETNGRIMDISTIDMNNDAGNTTFKLKLKAYSYAP